MLPHCVACGKHGHSNFRGLVAEILNDLISHISVYQELYFMSFSITITYFKTPTMPRSFDSRLNQATNMLSTC